MIHGLGLNLCKNIIYKLGGQIDLIPTKFKGCKYQFNLPLHFTNTKCENDSF